MEIQIKFWVSKRQRTLMRRQVRIYGRGIKKSKYQERS